MSNHGHVFKNATGVVARCGGPALCSECTKDAQLAAADALAKAARGLDELKIGSFDWWSAVKAFQDALSAYEKSFGG